MIVFSPEFETTRKALTEDYERHIAMRMLAGIAPMCRCVAVPLLKIEQADSRIGEKNDD